MPPRSSAVPSADAEAAPTPRDRHLQGIAEHGRMGWQKRSGYNKRARAEAAIGRWKQVIGDGLRARGRASGDRGERRRPCAQPHAGVRTPELCPHRMNPGGVRAIASTCPIRAPRPPAVLVQLEWQDGHLEWQDGHPGIRDGAILYAGPVPGTTGRIRATTPHLGQHCLNFGLFFSSPEANEPRGLIARLPPFQDPGAGADRRLQQGGTADANNLWGN